MISTLKNRELFKIEEEIRTGNHYGSNQEWYRKRWQRMAGCGPSAATNIIYYFNRTRERFADCFNSLKLTRGSCLNLMNELWNYVTPSLMGVNSTLMLCEGMERYLEAKNIEMRFNRLDIPKTLEKRPDFVRVTEFIAQALNNDVPVAFLNFDHGSVLELDSWHWVTIIALEADPGRRHTYVDILDGGMINRIDLSLWYQTTKTGGGFVSFDS